MQPLCVCVLHSSAPAACFVQKVPLREAAALTTGGLNGVCAPPQQLKPYIQYLPTTAELILKTSGRGSFIAPAVGFLHYGPDCYLYDHVCNFNYQGGVPLKAAEGSAEMLKSCVAVHEQKRARGPCMTMLACGAEPCNLHGTCQTNNTCFCTNGYATCRPPDGTITGATAGCETDIYTDKTNCGTCGNVRCISHLLVLRQSVQAVSPHK